MKYLYLLLICVTVNYVHAQVDITSNVQNSINGGANANSLLIDGDYLLEAGESITVDVVLGQIILTSHDSNVDTVRSNLFIRAFVASGTTEITLSSDNGGSKTFDVSITSEGNVSGSGTIDFVEGTTSTLTIENTSTTNAVTFNRLTLQTGSQTAIISNTNNGLLGQKDVFFSNPVLDGMLHIRYLPANFISATVELINMEGTLMLSKTITQHDASIDVSTLNRGVYLLREAETANVKKIVIQ